MADCCPLSNYVSKHIFNAVHGEVLFACCNHTSYPTSRGSAIHFVVSYDRSVASSKASSPAITIQCFLYQFPGVSHFLNVIRQLITSPSSSSSHFYPSLYLSFNNLFQKAVPTQNVTNPITFIFSIVCRILLHQVKKKNSVVPRISSNGKNGGVLHSEDCSS